MTEWRHTAPPNETIVEVEYSGEIIRVKAYYGRDGIRPHWKSENELTSWPVDAFSRWRLPTQEPTK